MFLIFYLSASSALFPHESQNPRHFCSPVSYVVSSKWTSAFSSHHKSFLCSKEASYLGGAACVFWQQFGSSPIIVFGEDLCFYFLSTYANTVVDPPSLFPKLHSASDTQRVFREWFLYKVVTSKLWRGALELKDAFTPTPGTKYLHYSLKASVVFGGLVCPMCPLPFNRDCLSQSPIFEAFVQFTFVNSVHLPGLVLIEISCLVFFHQVYQ